MISTCRIVHDRRFIKQLGTNESLIMKWEDGITDEVIWRFKQCEEESRRQWARGVESHEKISGMKIKRRIIMIPEVKWMKWIRVERALREEQKMIPYCLHSEHSPKPEQWIRRNKKRVERMDAWKETLKCVAYLTERWRVINSTRYVGDFNFSQITTAFFFDKNSPRKILGESSP